MKTFTSFLLLTVSGLVLSKENISDSFLPLFNSGDRQDITEYLANNMAKSALEGFGIDAHVDTFLNTQNTHGELTLLKQLPAKNGHDHLLVLSKNNQLTYTLVINRENKKPHGINYFFYVIRLWKQT